MKKEERTGEGRRKNEEKKKNKEHKDEFPSYGFFVY